MAFGAGNMDVMSFCTNGGLLSAIPYLQNEDDDVEFTTMGKGS